MNYQEWLEWRKTIDPAKESRQEGCILSISTAAEKIKEEGSKEFGEKTAAYGMALNTLYLGDEYVTEEEWQKAYVTAYDYVNNELKNEDNFKELITTGIESSSMGENARDLFINLEEVNRDLELNADLKWYAEKNSEINPNASKEIAALLGVPLAPQEVQKNNVPQDNSVIDDNDFEIDGLVEDNQLDKDGNVRDKEGNIIRKAASQNGDDDLDLNENLNINQLIEERNTAVEQPQDAPYEEDELENDAEEPVDTDDYDVITKEEAEEAEKESAALIAKKEAERKKKLEEQKQQLKEAAEKVKKEKAEAAEKKKKEAEAEKKDKLEREKKRRERTYEVKDDLKKEKSENAYLKDLFKDEKEELTAKHGNLIRGWNSEAHDDLVDAYDKFMRSLNTKNPKYSRDIKSKRKMKLKETAMEYVRMKKEIARLNGDKNVDDPDWVPKTRMGRRRYRSAKAIIENLEKFETDYDRLVMFEDDLTAKRTIGASGSSDDHADLSRSFKSLKNYLKYEDRNSDPVLKQKLMDDLRRDAERYLKKTAGEHLNDPNWAPRTTMGKRRFAAAKAVIIRLNQMEGKNRKKGQSLNNNSTNKHEENRKKENERLNNSIRNNQTNNQQPLNNDDIRYDLPEEMRLENEENEIRRSNSITPKSKRLDRFKEEFERKLEKEAEKLDSHLDDIDVTNLQGETRKRKKKESDRKDGAVLYSGKVLTRVSRDHMVNAAQQADTKEKLENTFTDICAIMVASGNFTKSSISEDEMMQSKEALRSNREFMDKVKNMTRNELTESMKDPAAEYQKIKREITNEKYDKMLEENKQSSLAASNDITAQQNLYINSVAVEYAKQRGDNSPDAVDNALQTINANKDFMQKVNMMENNDLKKGIQEPQNAFKDFTATEASHQKEPRDIDIQNNKRAYQERANNHIDSLDRISAKSCVNAMDKLKALADSNQPLTEKQMKEAKQWMAVMVANEYIQTDKKGSLHNQFRKTKKGFFDNYVKNISNSPEYNEAVPKEIDADYIKNFLAGKNEKGPKYLKDAVKKNRVKNKELSNHRQKKRNAQKAKEKPRDTLTQVNM